MSYSFKVRVKDGQVSVPDEAVMSSTAPDGDYNIFGHYQDDQSWHNIGVTRYDPPESAQTGAQMRETAQAWVAAPKEKS